MHGEETTACKSHLISVPSDEHLACQSQQKLIMQRLEAAGTDPKTLATYRSLLEQLSASELGRFLLIHKGLNGRWTDYLIAYPDEPASYRFQNELEEFLVTKAPVARATQERFQIFRRLCQSFVRPHARLASVPCGLMRELLTLDFTGVEGVSLTGIDLDPQSLEMAGIRARELGLEATLELRQADIFAGQAQAEFDLITSNGLNIYLRESSQQVELYRRFFEMLRPGGSLMISFLPPPPGPSGSHWDHSTIDPAALLRQKEVFADVLQTAWQCFVTLAEFKGQLQGVGFTELAVHYDRARMFPTVVARKP